MPTDARDDEAAVITGATCGLCGRQIVPDYPARPDIYIHRDTGDEDCQHDHYPNGRAASDRTDLPDWGDHR